MRLYTEADVLKGLNEQQKDVVLTYGKPILTLAGAGAGKTSSLTKKICHMVLVKNIPIDEILALTFTRKASIEMQERIKDYLGLQVTPKWISTFHSLGTKILRGNMKRLGYKDNFTIYDSNDSKTLIKSIVDKYVDDNSLSSMVYTEELLKSLISRIKLSSSYKDGFETLKATYRLPNVNNMDKFFTHIEDVFNIYQGELKKNNAVDFDDILVHTVVLLKEHADIREELQNRFKYILVDEYQDTNGIQYEMLKLLVGEKHKNNIMVVGDPQQSIYGFRGALIQTILGFDKDFENTKVVKLETNYRSTHNIIKFANKIFTKANIAWKDKLLELKPSHTATQGNEVVINRFPTDDSEAMYIVNQIKQLVRNSVKYSDITILVRMSFLSRIIEENFIRNGIPYHLLNSIPFYERAEIKTLISYLKFMVNPDDKHSLDKIINVPSRTIGKQALTTIESHYAGDWIQAIENSANTLRGLASVNAKQFVSIIRDISTKFDVDKQPYHAVMELINRLKYYDYIASKYPENVDDRNRNIQELVSLFQHIEDTNATFSDFIIEHLQTPKEEDKNNQNKVTIMTIHASKGLEFPVVFLPALENDILPSNKAKTPEQIEEERRLFYVACTRAKKLCLISSAQNRGFASQGGKMKKEISMFLKF